MIPKTRARVSFLDSEGNSVPGPIFEVQSMNPLADITQVELWPENSECRTEGDFFEDIREEDDDADHE